jgi:hypothetical protein
MVSSDGRANGWAGLQVGFTYWRCAALAGLVFVLFNAKTAINAKIAKGEQENLWLLGFFALFAVLCVFAFK